MQESHCRNLGIRTDVNDIVHAIIRVTNEVTIYLVIIQFSIEPSIGTDKFLAALAYRSAPIRESPRANLKCERWEELCHVRAAMQSTLVDGSGSRIEWCWRNDDELSWHNLGFDSNGGLSKRTCASYLDPIMIISSLSFRLSFCSPTIERTRLGICVLMTLQQMQMWRGSLRSLEKEVCGLSLAEHCHFSKLVV